MKIAFIHPDLGIGGAERLVVDAAVGLQNRGHEVTIYTSHCDKSHSFEEVKSGQLKVEVRGDFLPTQIAGRFFIVCAALRQFYLTYDLIKTGVSHDVFVIDQLSYCVPFIREYLGKSRILFYCHFPDQLLAQRQSLLKELYRIPFDYFEQWTTNLSDVIVVNSNFTKSVFKKTFKQIRRVPDVIYPCVDVDYKIKADAENPVIDQLTEPFFLSINRFEKKKDIELALEAFTALRRDNPVSEWQEKLVIAGGYDPRVPENVEYLQELVKKAEGAKFTAKVFTSQDLASPDVSFKDINVIFLPSISTNTKNLLLAQTRLLLYTPSFEHFGIVPLEAMLLKVPVLATNTGGPLETIIDSETGWNRSRNSEEWAKIMHHVLVEMNVEERKVMGDKARLRVIKEFSQSHMAEEFEVKLEAACQLETRPEEEQSLQSVLGWIKAALMALIAAIVIAWLRRRNIEW